MEHLSNEDRVRELGSFSMEKRILWGDLAAAFHYIKGACKKNENRNFSRACCDKIRGYSSKLKEGRLSTLTPRPPPRF